MVGSNFTDREEELLISRFLQKGYDSTRCQAGKKKIVSGLRQELRDKHGRRHPEMAIVKKWSDLKRRHMNLIRKIRNTFCPGAPLPYVRPKRRSQKPGPSHRFPSTSLPQAETGENVGVEEVEESQCFPSSIKEEKEEHIPYTPNQERAPLPYVKPKRRRQALEEAEEEARKEPKAEEEGDDGEKPGPSHRFPSTSPPQAETGENVGVEEMEESHCFPSSIKEEKEEHISYPPNQERAPLPYVRPKSRRQAVEEAEEEARKEQKAEEEEGDYGEKPGPSHRFSSTSPPQAEAGENVGVEEVEEPHCFPSSIKEEKEEHIPYTPNQEMVQQIKRVLEEMERSHSEGMRAVTQQLKQMEEDHQRGIRQIKDLLQKIV